MVIFLSSKIQPRIYQYSIKGRNDCLTLTSMSLALDGLKIVGLALASALR